MKLFWREGGTTVMHLHLSSHDFLLAAAQSPHPRGRFHSASSTAMLTCCLLHAVATGTSVITGRSCVNHGALMIAMPPLLAPLLLAPTVDPLGGCFLKCFLVGHECQEHVTIVRFTVKYPDVHSSSVAWRPSLPVSVAHAHSMLSRVF